MRVVTSREELRQARADLVAAGAAGIGFVPTMGYLHEGHLSLVRAAREQNAVVVVSIFVNPTQFGEGEDLDSYPRDLTRDLAMLADAGVDLVWTPGVADVYPPGFDTYVTPGRVAEVLEGARRPGHFRGVATVLTILFRVLEPQRAYFGQKDAQQVAVVRQLVRDLVLDVEVIAHPIVREADGLAMSSRNTYLSAEDRAAAPVLSRALRAAEQAWQGGERDAGKLRDLIGSVLAGEPRAEVEYVSVAHPDSLTELSSVDPAVGALASLAVRVGRPRLIDNVTLSPCGTDD